MSSAVATVTPFQDPSRKHRLVKIGCWLVGLLVLAVVLRLLGVDVIGWLKDVWTQIKDVPLQYLRAGRGAADPADVASTGWPTTGSSPTRTRAACSSGRSSRPTRSASR